MWYWSLGIVIFGIGASVGSFLNVVSDRVPDGRSLLGPRSFCDSCKRTIPSRELFPVFSYILLGGKCRECGAPIPLRVLGVELVSGLLFLAIFLKFGLIFESLVLSFAVSLLTVVAVIDLEHGLIINKIVLPSIVVLLLLAPFWSYFGPARTFLGLTGMLDSLSNSLAAGLVAFLLLLAIFLISPAGMGFGDVKFAPAIGLMVGFPEVMMALWLAFVTGGVVAIFLMVLRKKGRKDAIPFGEFLSLGGVLVLLAGSELMSTYDRMMESIVGLYL